MSVTFPVNVTLQGSKPRFEFIDYRDLEPPGFEVLPALRLMSSVSVVNFDFHLADDEARFIVAGNIVEHTWGYARPQLPNFAFNNVESRRFSLVWDDGLIAAGELLGLSILSFAVDDPETAIPFIVARNDPGRRRQRATSVREPESRSSEPEDQGLPMITFRVGTRRPGQPTESVAAAEPPPSDRFLWFELFNYDYQTPDGAFPFRDRLFFPEPVVAAPSKRVFRLAFVLPEGAAWESEQGNPEKPVITWRDLEDQIQGPQDPVPRSAIKGRNSLLITVGPGEPEMPLRFETRAEVDGEFLDFDPGIFRRDTG